LTEHSEKIDFFFCNRLKFLQKEALKLVDFGSELEIIKFWSFHKRVQFLVVYMPGGLPGKR
jgi:hypothetical protein